MQYSTTKTAKTNTTSAETKSITTPAYQLRSTTTSTTSTSVTTTLPAGDGTRSNPYIIHVRHKLELINAIFRLASLAYGLAGGAVTPEAPGSAIPTDALAGIIGEHLKTALPSNCWFIMDLGENYLGEGVKAQDWAYFWDGERISMICNRNDGLPYRVPYPGTNQGIEPAFA